MKNKKNIQKKVCGVITKIASKTAHDSMGSSCLWWQYQPNCPKALKKSK